MNFDVSPYLYFFSNIGIAFFRCNALSVYYLFLKHNSEFEVHQLRASNAYRHTFRMILYTSESYPELIALQNSQIFFFDGMKVPQLPILPACYFICSYTQFKRRHIIETHVGKIKTL